MNLRHAAVRPVLLLLALAAFPPAVRAAGVPESAYSDLRWRLLGPFRAGWATAGAGVPGDATTFYFGAAGGGVWKTTDAGVTWHPLERKGSAAIGAIAVAPSDPRVLWVGTGHVQQRWDILPGDGIYRSTDAGATWTHAGLAKSGHVGQILVDPKRPEVALVAALGPIFAPGGERGVFRTEDGGKTWTRTLFTNDDTGAVHLAWDPKDPSVVFASLWQARRHPWLDYFQPNVGAGSGIWKSTDGGRSFARLTNGLPKEPMGRITLAVVPGTSGKRVLAGVAAEGDAKGLYRSDDGGATFSRVSGDDAIVGDYCSGITPDPRNPDVVWVMGRSMRRSTDGGKTFVIAKGAPGGDDYHGLWIDPTDARRMLSFSDQGAVVTLNGGASWSSWYNQPTGQFYRVATDDRVPYRVYSGQQDSGTVSIASRSDYGQLTFRDWNPVGGDERDADIPFPGDPDIVFGAGLGGRLSRWDARTGQVKNVSPWPVVSYGRLPVGARYRYSWITPIAISPRAPHAIYQGAQVLFRSTDRGESWSAISSDLTRAVPGAKDCEGEVPREKAARCGFGAIFAIAPSPAADGVVWVGTDDGLVHVTRDEGKSWKDVTPPGVTEWTKVNAIDAAHDDPATAYVAADRFRAGELRPLAFATHDGGATWTAIGAGLPADVWVSAVRADPKTKGLLYAATSRGVFVSFDDGARWNALSNGLPECVVGDLTVHGDDLAIATQGRGLFVLDDVGPLRHAAEAAAAGGPFLAPPSPAMRVRSNLNKDTPLPPDEPRALNGPVGAVLDYVLERAPKAPVTIEIADASGRVIRSFRSDAKLERRPAEIYFADLWLGAPPVPGARAGHNRFVWDLRLPPPPILEGEYDIAAVPGGPARVNPAGALVPPGAYEVRLTVDGVTRRQPLRVVADPRRPVSDADLAALLAFQKEVESALARAVDVVTRVKAAEKRLDDEKKDAKTRASAEARSKEISALSPLRDDEPKEVLSALTALATDLEAIDAAPTAPQRRLLAASREALDRFEAGWKRIGASAP